MRFWVRGSSLGLATHFFIGGVYYGKKEKTCCVFGHRRITGKTELKIKLTEIIENLIVNENVDTFLVGSRSDFDSLCREVLSKQKEKHPYIKRIYVRAEYEVISDDYEKYLL